MQLFAGHYREAFASAQAGLRAARQPDARLLLVLAAIALEHDNLVRARELADLAGQVGGAEGWRQVIAGRLALKASDTAAARSAARAAALAGVDHPAIAGELGVLFARTGLHAEAVPFFERAAAAAPDDAQTCYNLAIARQFSGDLAAARAGFAALVAAHPDHAQGWLALVQLDRQGDDALLPGLAERFERAMQPEARLAFGHAIAKLLEDLGRWDEALDWLERAKAARRGAVHYDRAQSDRLFRTAEASLRAPIPAADGDPAPLFIVGLPRTGTTLVERILSAHPAVRSAGELSDFAVLLKRRLGTPGPYVLDPATIAAGAAAADLTGIEGEYLARARSIAGEDCARVIDKMPFNLFFAPLILRALPGAKVICLRRSPFDALFSNFRQLFATGFSYYGYACDFEDCAHFVAGFERLADACARTLPADRFRCQRYEDIVADLEGEARALVAFAGLEWDAACLDFHRNAAPVATASSVQVRRPIYASSIGRWRRYEAGARRAIAALAAYGIAP
ncbi:tetratricopeptide repeat-containing sulfotransferase family protein [Novosphingobium album (ex Liu et al. 2023)]|uniref:tetratricopeptide repeat-containing sulfotransferase family protein n=1 Tax=Novosphingobium album (ex Liu et al. 2023) TaxID=3031130 RepID=UPI0023AEA472|nr:sulfotransferase [Novosphingobium album (ex Liu et al. 2023)]